MPERTDEDVQRDVQPDAPAPAASRDDGAWFTAVVREHGAALVRYFARRGPRQDAEDLAAEVFATAWRRRGDVPTDAVLPWLYRTAGFTLANHRRKLVDLPVDEVPETGSVRVGDDPELSLLFDAELRGALASVGERDRHILLLNAWEGLDGSSSPRCSASRALGRMPPSPAPANGCGTPGTNASPSRPPASFGPLGTYSPVNRTHGG